VQTGSISPTCAGRAAPAWRKGARMAKATIDADAICRRLAEHVVNVSLIDTV
jgi:hypothetical protein